MSDPPVSVLIPCFNAERTIGETLESVRKQTWANIEIIVVDDGSTDETVQVVESLRADNLRLVRSENSGASSARNHAYKLCNGKYIQFLDADDLISPTKIADQLDRLCGSPRAIASAPWARFYSTPESAEFKAEAVWRDLFPLDWLAMAGENGLEMMFPAIWLCPREVLEAAGPWNETLTVGDDGEFFTRVLLNATEVAFCPRARCYYRSGDAASLSARKSPEDIRSAFTAIEARERNILLYEDSERMRRAFALSWQHFAHMALPYSPELSEQASRRASSLHSVRIEPGGGPVFHLAVKVLGWRAARRLQHLSGRP